MADMNNRSGGKATSGENRYPNLTTEELQIIGYFAKGQRHSISSPALRLECTETSIRLVNAKGKLIGISKQTNEWQQKVLINSNSSYTSSIVEILTDLGFVTKQKSSHPDFTEHHYYQVPVGYKLNHTDVLQLWKVWWNNKRYQLNARNLPIDVLVFSKGNWCPVQDLQPKQGNFILKTDRGELTILAEDFVVWIDKSAPEVTTSAQPLPGITNQISAVPTPPVQTPLVGVGEASAVPTAGLTPTAEASPLENLPSAQTTPTEVMTNRSVPTLQPGAPIVAKQSEQKIDLPELEEHLDLESYLSTFNTEDTEDIDRIEGIYNIEELLNSTIGAAEVAPEVAPTPARSRSPFKLEVTVVEPAADPSASVPSQPPIGKPQPTPVVVIPTPARSPVTTQVEQPPVSNPVATVQTPPPSIADRKRSLKIKAVNTLTNYLKNGDTVTNTEVLKNGQGRVMNRKITTVHQGCPGWTVEQIKQLQDELAEI
jgi:hypothetical protein